MLEDSLLNLLSSFTTTTQEQMEIVTRWGKYVEKGSSPNNNLQHTFSISLLALFIIDSLDETNFDPYLIIRSILVHDMGEIDVGDTHYIDKSISTDASEIDSFSSQIENFSTSKKEYFLDGFLLQFATPSSRLQITNKRIQKKILERLKVIMKEHQTEAMILEAIERYDYLLYAYHEYKKNNNISIMVQVLRNQHRPLCNLAKKVPEFGKHFYTLSLQTKVESFLEKYEGQYIEES